MLKIVLQFGIFAIPSVIALLIWKKKQSVDFVIRLKQFVICFFCINFSTYLAFFVMGIKKLPFQNMSYSYCIKWLAVSVGFAICYSLGAPYIQKCFDKKNKTQQAIIVLLTQSVVIAICFLLWCSTEYKNVDVTGLMHPGEHTYIDDAGMWYIDEDSGYQSKDIILSGPYISLEKGSYTVTVEYDSHKTQFFQVKSEHHFGSLESEESTFLGGGVKQCRKTNIRVNGELDDLDIQIRYSGKGDIRIAHIWIQQNHAVHIEYILIITVLFLAWDLWKYLYEIRKINCPSKEFVGMVCCASLSTLAVSFSGRVAYDGTFFSLLRGEISGVGIVFFIVGAAILAFYKCYPVTEKGCRIEIKGLAVIFTLCTIAGISISANGNLTFLLNSPLQFCVCMLTTIGYYILFRNGIYWLFVKVDFILNSWKFIISEQNVTGKTFLWTLGILSLFWVPLWICFLPGSITWDGMVQINMALGVWDVTNHHPWISTLFMKTLLKVGLGVNDNMGVFILVLGNEIIEIFIYSYVCCVVRRIFGAKAYIGAMMFYTLHPIFSMFGQLVMKDGLYAAVFTLYMAEYVKCMAVSREKKDIAGRQLLILAAIGAAACVLRKNGIYIIFPAYMGILFEKLSLRKRALIAAFALSIVSCFVVVDRILPVRLGIKQGSPKEMLSIPFQQTARCFRDYESDITAEEYAIVDRVLDAGHLKELYNPELSDPVKDTYRENVTSKEFQDYLKIWEQMLRKYPVTYVEATLQNSYGYYYPFENFRGKQIDYIGINYNPMTGDFDSHYLFSYEVRNKIGEYIFAWKSLPILSLFMNTGSYTWLLFLAAGYTLYHKRYRELVVYIAPFMNVLVCIASPVNGEIRYALPLMAVAPLLVCWCCSQQSMVGADD